MLHLFPLLIHCARISIWQVPGIWVILVLFLLYVGHLPYHESENRFGLGCILSILHTFPQIQNPFLFF